MTVNPRVASVDTSTARSLHSGGERPADCSRCHRGKLEALLGEGLDIKWGHTITGVSQNSQQITLDIENEPPIEAVTLIAANGVHSTVRKSLVPDAHPEVHCYAVFYGTRRMSSETYARLIALQMQNGTSTEFWQDDVLLRIFINNTTSTHIGLGYTYSRPARQEWDTDPLYKPNRPTAGANDIPENFYAELGSLKDLEPAYAAVFDLARVRDDRVLHWLMRSVHPSGSHMQALANGGIIMIGDAVHAMPILGSKGANLAIQDGLELAEWIVKNGMKGLGMFVEERSEEWEDCMEEGVQRLEDMHKGEKASL